MQRSTGFQIYRYVWTTAVLLLAMVASLLLCEGGQAAKLSFKAPRPITPKPKSTLGSSHATFKWAGVGARRYEIYIGSRRGRSDIFRRRGLRKRAVRVRGLPTDGRRLYVRIVARFSARYRCGRHRCRRKRTRSYVLRAHRTRRPQPNPNTQLGPEPMLPGAVISPPSDSDTPSPPAASQESSITAVWANDGGDKVVQDELRATENTGSVGNSVWDGSRIRVFGARNEVVSFNLVLEAAEGASDVSVSFNKLVGPGGAEIKSVPASGEGLFDWTGRDIELFYVRYLQIKGLSRLAYESYYDERHVPKALQRPFTGQGEGSGDWYDRPNHDKLYPDIAIPIELEQGFDIDTGTNQSIWSDIYIPKGSPAGTYSGKVTVEEGGVATYEIPVELEVHDFQLPDTPSAKTMVFLSTVNINRRYLGQEYPGGGSPEDQASRQIQDRHFQLAHRHRLSLIESDNESGNSPNDIWIPRLNGTLFTAANGYRGPGEGVGNNVYSVGSYSSWWWSWDDNGDGQISEAEMRDHSDVWVNWFGQNAPGTDFFLYLIDESNNYQQIEQWAQWLNQNPGSGSQLDSMATVWLTDAQANTPSLDIAGTGFTVGPTGLWENAVAQLAADPGKKHIMYNGRRPTHGSLALEDEGVALRVTPWAQFKKGVDRWFTWESTYYNNFQSIVDPPTDQKTCDYRDVDAEGNTLRCQTNVFRTAKTFGAYQSDCFDSTDCGGTPYGQTGWNYTNGDGVLFYPGTDTVFPNDSYGVDGPIASLRLKQWRRGIQDVDYLTMARQIDPQQVDQIVSATIPKVLWEYGVDNQADPTYVHTDISWSTDPDVWETARAQLAEIIEGD